jgi:hypothetical protein
MSLAIIKYQPSQQSNFDAFVAAMFLMFARAPRKAEPDIDGSYELGEIGSAPEKSWTRLTPYSIARTAIAEAPADEDFADACKCGEPDCVAHEVIDKIIQFPGFTSRLLATRSPHEVIVFEVPLTQAFYEKGELPEAEYAAHPGPFRHRWLPL